MFRIMIQNCEAFISIFEFALKSVGFFVNKALFDKLLKMFKPLKMKIFNGFNFSICLITKF